MKSFFAVISLFVAVPLAAHNGMREIRGTIARVADTSIVVTRTDGASENVPLAATTKFKVGKSRATAADMRVGSRVIVHYGHDGKALEIDLPPRR